MSNKHSNKIDIQDEDKIQIGALDILIPIIVGILIAAFVMFACASAVVR